ncbi:putative CRISPR-associated protein [Tolypothrix sp. VBCCA 56010]|uniref:putative CRISPR-associated protein n=1 Tax=Tolypothrix sp. VBCCA 56010 TaxID=3137731 RepID=UPI003D7E81D8
MKKNILICTVGTSLFKPNLFGLPVPDKYDEWVAKQPKTDHQYLSVELITNLKTALTNQNWKHIAELLNTIPGTTRLCGAEINSISDLVEREYCADKSLLFFCYSATEEGENIAKILQYYYQFKGHIAKPRKIEYLQDKEPKLFRTKGLRNLVKEISRIVQEYHPDNCAINATGGYKAQIAIGVLMGQSLGVPVYYKHEFFSEIIAFPPMPIGLDFSLWLEKSGWLTALDRGEILGWHEVEDDWDERMESLIERVECNDGKIILELSPTGQIFHDTFKGRFQSCRDKILPPSVPSNQKQPPSLPNHSWGNARTPILNFLEKIVSDFPYVRACRTDYWNPDLSSTPLFRLKKEAIEGIFSNGTWTVKFFVETSATTSGQLEACIADLNQTIYSL